MDTHAVTEPAPLPPSQATRTRKGAPPRCTDPLLLPIHWAKRGRSKEGELARRVRRDLIAHLGGKPSATQSMLIARMAWLLVHMARIDERAMAGDGLSAHATREYLAWHGQVARGLAQLGLKGAPARIPTPAEVMAGRAA